jgi:hypothetical protein
MNAAIASTPLFILHLRSRAALKANVTFWRQTLPAFCG